MITNLGEGTTKTTQIYVTCCSRFVAVQDMNIWSNDLFKQVWIYDATIAQNKTRSRIPGEGLWTPSSWFL